MSYAPVAYQFQAATHCPDCTEKAFPGKGPEYDETDNEGNPVHPIYGYQLHELDDYDEETGQPIPAFCDDCLEVL